MGKKGGNRGVRIKQMGPKGAGKMFNPMEELAAGIPQDEMINLPPPPDRNMQLFWPIQQSFSMDASQFQIIYPSYLDATKSVKQGRRIGKEVAVDRPTVSDISTALQSLQIRHVLQPHKGYSRDIETLWENPGRIKYDHLHANNTATSKRELLIELAKIIPTLPQRQQRLQAEEQERLLREQEEAEAQKAQQNQKLLLEQQKQQQTSAAAGVKSNKKKGKKKR